MNDRRHAFGPGAPAAANAVIAAFGSNTRSGNEGRTFDVVRDFVRRPMERAKAAKSPTLLLAMDLQVVGQRHKDPKNSIRSSRRGTVANILNIVTKPRWALGQSGVAMALEIVRKELDLTMAFCGQMVGRCRASPGFRMSPAYP